MSLPIDLVLVRHGESEGNVAKKMSENGDHSAYLKIHKSRHARSYRLSEKGREQAIRSGEWINKEFTKNGKSFDRFAVSEFTRALETAGLLGLPDAMWRSSFYLSERDWGDLDGVNEEERNGKFKKVLEMRMIEPFFWRPPNGESFVDLCLRLDRVLDTLHRECSDKRVIIVCHGEVMRAFRVLIERTSQQAFKDSYVSSDKDEKIFNCEIIHYSRRDPNTNKIDDHVNWIRRVRPSLDPVWDTGWKKIEKKTYTNQELLSITNETLPVLF